MRSGSRSQNETRGDWSQNETRGDRRSQNETRGEGGAKVRHEETGEAQMEESVGIWKVRTFGGARGHEDRM